MDIRHAYPRETMTPIDRPAQVTAPCGILPMNGENRRRPDHQIFLLHDACGETERTA
jgi:hypothetical protein